jgi:hypothetical protein
MMSDNERVILIAWPRSGSSSLWQIMRSHPQLQLMEDEPFNEYFASWAPGNLDYLARIYLARIETESFDGVPHELFAEYNGIKILSYQLDEEQLTSLIGRRDVRLVYINRRNLLQTAVSDQVAKYAKLWNRWDLDAGESLERRYDGLPSLDLDDLRTYIDDLVTHRAWVESLLDRRGDAGTVRLRYEDLYFATRESQHAQLADVWQLLDVAPLDAPTLDYYLDPRTAKLAAANTYGRLPNADEIDAALGADDTGWLFPFVPPTS